MKCAIFAGGEIKDISFIDPERVKAEYDFVICADGGYIYAREKGIEPDVIVGDFDSYTGNLPESAEIFRTVPEKDDTDTLMAVRIAIERGCTEIFLYGALGKRFDHSFANIQTLLFAYENGCQMNIIDSDNEISLQGAGEKFYPAREGWYFSIFSLTDETLIESYSGVKYPLENYLMKKSYPIGASNEITGSGAVLRIKSGVVLVVRSEMAHFM